jgi:hypothetical protein
MARRGVDYWLIDIPIGRNVTIIYINVSRFIQGKNLKQILYKKLQIKKIMMFPYVDTESNAASSRKGKLSLILVILFVHIICLQRLMKQKSLV